MIFFSALPIGAATRLLGRATAIGIALALWSPVHAADPIWHCSRSVPLKTPTARATLSFDLSESTTIEIALIDLFQVYSGGTVLMGSQPLAACFIKKAPLTDEAMSEVDVDPETLSSLTNSGTTGKTKIYSVNDEEQMKICIAKNHPAVGYLSQVTETDLVGPCF